MSKTKDEQYAVMKREVVDKINNWDELYDFYDFLMGRVRATMHPLFVFDSLFVMYAFLRAMRELPEEGDVKVLVERMAHIMIYESEEKLGAKIAIIQPSEQMPAAGFSDEALQALAEFSTMDQTPGKRTH